MTELGHCLTQVMNAAGGATTLRGAARRLAAGLSQTLSVAALELWIERPWAGFSAESVLAQPDREGGWALDVLAGAPGPFEGACRARPSAELSAEVRARAAGFGADRALELPLGGRPAGSARLYVREPPPWLVADGGLSALAGVLGLVLRTTQVASRVAAVSRGALEENRELRQALAGQERGPRLIARSAPMRQALERLTAVAPFETTVLLRGESGSGKELLARQLHDRSPRAAGAFVAVNCGALPEGLIESELFGHEQGAFTGAVRRHRGAFERAEGGTLFLDEIGDLPLSAQVKLLRVLQEWAFSPLGSEDSVVADVRVVAATHQDLEARVRAGEFREDLYYRLEVFPIRVPPVRERQADLPQLIEALLEELRERLGLPALALTRGAQRKLLEHDWPGNARQLKNALERAAILSGGGSVRTSDLEWAAAPTESVATPWRQPVVPFDDACRAALEAALSVSGGRVYGPGGAAELLELKPTTVQTKLRRLGIRKEPFRAGRA